MRSIHTAIGVNVASTFRSPWSKLRVSLITDGGSNSGTRGSVDIRGRDYGAPHNAEGRRQDIVCLETAPQHLEELGGYPDQWMNHIILLVGHHRLHDEDAMAVHNVLGPCPGKPVNLLDALGPYSSSKSDAFLLILTSSVTEHPTLYACQGVAGLYGG